jgi:hypothetical protein
MDTPEQARASLIQAAVWSMEPSQVRSLSTSNLMAAVRRIAGLRTMTPEETETARAEFIVASKSPTTLQEP